MSRRSPLALAAALLLVVALLPTGATASTVWRLNVYRSAGQLYQDPYYTACTAAAVMMMLNFTDLANTGGSGFRWTNYRTQLSADKKNVRDMTSILYFERAHDTLALGRPGSDAHGWRNALNYYGWGLAAMTDPTRRVYDDRAYGSFESALKGIVRSIAMYRKPVGILAWGGQHAQVATGYAVTGENPATSTNFTVNGLYITDPLRSDGYVNRYVGHDTLMIGNLRLRFRRYVEIDSPLDDPYTAGYRKSSVASTTSEWYHRWVVVQPIRSGLPAATPAPTPSPTPAPTPTPTTAPTPAPTPSPTAASTPTATPDAPTAAVEATATASPSPTPVATPAEPAATPTEAPSGEASGSAPPPG